MSFDIESLVAKWEQDEPHYRNLGELLLPKMKEAISDLEIFPDIQYRVKELLSIVRKIKKKNRNAKYSYSDLTDKLGFRIICAFTDEMELVDKFIISNFKVIKTDKKKDQLDHHTLDYISNHYDVQVLKNKWNSKLFKPFQDLTFEIQVKTLNQHTWSSTSHALSYKQEANLSPIYMRKIFRLLSLYEIADDEFMSVNNFLRNDESNLVYTLLRKIEGKIYKYAKVDFDRDTSLEALNILISYFKKDELTLIMKNIESFIESNHDRIKSIFQENRNRYHEMPIVTQPEIFLIWYALDNYPFSITDNWNNNFDPEELEQIMTLWGALI